MLNPSSYQNEVIFRRPVDLITVNGLSPYMRPVIEKEVISIYE